MSSSSLQIVNAMWVPMIVDEQIIASVYTTLQNGVTKRRIQWLCLTFMVIATVWGKFFFKYDASQSFTSIILEFDTHCQLPQQNFGMPSRVNQSIKQTNYIIVRPKVDQRAGKLSLPHVGITKTEK